jgi:hypothetical protein
MKELMSISADENYLALEMDNHQSEPALLYNKAGGD